MAKHTASVPSFSLRWLPALLLPFAACTEVPELDEELELREGETEGQDGHQAVSFQITILDAETELDHVEELGDELLLVFHDPELTALFEPFHITAFRQLYPDSRFAHLRAVYEITADSAALMDELPAARPDLFFAPELVTEPIPLHTPNDFGLATGSQKDLEWIRVEDAWDLTTGSPNVVIGITDTGFDVNHPDLASKIANLRGNTTNMNHGTMVASVAGAATNNGVGISGVGYQSMLDLGTSGLGTVLAMSADGVPVINNSWFNSCSPSVSAEGVSHEIYENGSLTTWGAGNGYHHCQFNEIYPAAFPHNVSVTSVGADIPYGVMSQWPGSGGPIAWNWQDVHWNVVGKTATTNNVVHPTEIHNHNPSVDLAAPGYHVRVATPNNGYASNAHGTSFAAPQVAGVAALMLAAKPCLSPYQLEVGLVSTARNIDAIPENQAFAGGLGAGTLDAHAAVAWAQGQSCDDPATATMMVRGLDLNTLCKPGHSTSGALPQLEPLIEHGLPPFTARWQSLPGNTATLSSTTALAPTVVSANGNRVHYQLVVTDSSPVPKVAMKVVDLELTTAQTHDLAMMDSFHDPLGEPNAQAQIDPRDWSVWQSPDVWNRQQQDGVTRHEDPEYFQNAPNYAYARVRNIGCAPSPIGADLRLYWTKASTGEDWDQDWTTTVVTGTGGLPQPGGREITNSPIAIPVIQPGGEWVASHAWNPVRPQDYNASINSVDVCFLARIEESASAPFGMTFAEQTLVKDNIINNNNIATRNFLVRDLYLNKFGQISELERHELMVANPGDEPEAFGLELIQELDIHPQLGSALGDMEIWLELGDSFDRWDFGSFEGVVDPELRAVLYDGSEPLRLGGLELQPGEKVAIVVEVVALGAQQGRQRVYLRQYSEGQGEAQGTLYGAVGLELRPAQ